MDVVQRALAKIAASRERKENLLRNLDPEIDRERLLEAQKAAPDETLLGVGCEEMREFLKQCNKSGEAQEVFEAFAKAASIGYPYGYVQAGKVLLLNGEKKEGNEKV